MDVKKRGKRFFVITMTVLMFILTVGTIIFAEEGRGSYSLVIQKILAQGSPEEAKNKEYNGILWFNSNNIENPMD